MAIRIFIESDKEKSKFIHEFFTTDICEITENIEDCDYILSSKIPWGNCDIFYIQSVIESYRNVSKRVLIFLVSDTSDVFRIPSNVFLFRTSINKSNHHSSNEYILPYIWERIMRPYNPLYKTRLPLIGFCGLLNMYRHEILNVLSDNPNIETKFIVRDQFWGGTPHCPKLIKEFQDNIINTHFTVCNRGAGNFSMRFYQVLSAGRIPIVIDTDMIFPFENEILWDDIIIRGKDSSEVINKLYNVWYTKDIIQMQTRCKEIYDTYFSPLSYFKIILKSLGSK
jgi:hypothetical protein